MGALSSSDVALPDAALVGTRGSWRTRLTSGIAWSLVASVLQQGSLLVASVLIARWVGKAQFGAFVLLQGTLGTFALLASGAFAITATRHVAALRVENPDRTASLCRLLTISTGAISLTLAVLLALCSGYLADHTLHDPSLTPLLRWGSLYLFFQAYQGVQSGILCGVEAFALNAGASLLRAVTLIVGVMVLTPIFGVTGAISALVISAIATCVCFEFLLPGELRRRGIPTAAQLDWSDLRTIWKFSVPAFLSTAMVPPVLWIANVMLARQPGGYSEVAIFGAASQWRAVVAFVPAALAQPLLPLLTSALVSGRRGDYRRLAMLGVLISAGSATLVAIVVVTGAPFIAALYGKGFAQSAPVLTELSIATIIAAAASAVGYVLASIDDMWAGVVLNAIWAMAFLGILSSYVAVDAAAVARSFLLAYGVHAVTTTLYTLLRLRRVISWTR